MSPARVGTIAAALIAVVFAAGLAVGVTRLAAPPDYGSSTVVIIDQPVAIAAVPNAGILDKLSRLRLKYAGLLRTHELQEPIAEASGVDVDRVAGTLQVQVEPESLLLTLRGRSSDADVARAVADHAADVLISYTQQEQQAAGIPDDQRFEFRVVTPASAARDVTDERGRVLPVVASGLGLLVALGAAVAASRRR